jgi:hypothetical protein
MTRQQWLTNSWTDLPLLKHSHRIIPPFAQGIPFLLVSSFAYLGLLVSCQEKLIKRKIRVQIQIYNNSAHFAAE